MKFFSLIPFQIGIRHSEEPDYWAWWFAILEINTGDASHKCLFHLGYSGGKIRIDLLYCVNWTFAVFPRWRPHA